jgi:UDP-N-acetyl-2-amino-2-deoxyglucuronate dehydrogenase
MKTHKWKRTQKLLKMSGLSTLRFEALRVGIIGTGAIAHKHAQACLNVGVEVVACCNRDEQKGRAFAAQYGAEFFSSHEEVCNHPRVDYVDVCTYPNFRLTAVEACARAHKHVHVQKPMSTSLSDAARMIELARRHGILLGVASQQRFGDGALFLKRALESGRLGKLIQADAYVKWHRSPEYYDRPGKGSWELEGGGALINQAIHQVDLLRWLAGEFLQVFGCWQLGAVHAIQSEDVFNGIIRYASGATGVIQASTAIWPGFTERLEFHGTNGSAVLTGDRISTWSVRSDWGEAPTLGSTSGSGAADPMAISLQPFERQILDFVKAIESGKQPLVDGEEGYKTLRAVLSFYQSCRTGRAVDLKPD